MSRKIQLSVLLGFNTAIVIAAVAYSETWSAQNASAEAEHANRSATSMNIKTVDLDEVVSAHMLAESHKAKIH